MDIFFKHFKQKFKPLATEYGFKSHGKAYYRVINDVVQYFLLHRWVPHGRSCTIDFSVLPLCIGLDKRAFLSASKNICQLMGVASWWEYNSNSEDNILSTLEKMQIATEEYLIPFFEKTSDCASAYEEICQFEQSLYTGINGGILMIDRVK